MRIVCIEHLQNIITTRRPYFVVSRQYDNTTPYASVCIPDQPKADTTIRMTEHITTLFKSIDHRCTEAQ